MNAQQPIKWTSAIGYGCMEDERITDHPIQMLYAYKETIEAKVTKGETLTDREIKLHTFFQDEKVQKRMSWTRRKKESNSMDKAIQHGFRPVLRGNIYSR